MIIVSEETCTKIIDRASAFTAVEQVFAAMARGDAYNFPVIREAIGQDGRPMNMGNDALMGAQHILIGRDLVWRQAHEAVPVAPPLVWR
jgi:hypothetical protein